jgi:ArsR family transcriptional regulator
MSNYRNIELEQYAGIFKALSNPHRLSIFMRLATCCSPGAACENNEICECVGELSKNLSIAPSTVSHHIKELNRASLISLRRRGQNIECSVSPDTLDKLSTFFKQHVTA